MAEELLRVLEKTNRKNLSLTLKALQYFENKTEYIFPLSREDSWFNRESNPQTTKVEMDVLYRAGLIRREEVPGRIPYTGYVLVYELNEAGDRLFRKIFQKAPQICSAPHYAMSG